MAKIGRKLLVLQFEDPDFTGVEVRVYSAPLRLVLELSGQAEAARANEGIDRTGQLIDEFIKRLESWNIENDEGDVPPTRDGLLSLDLSDAYYILVSWFDAMMSVSRNLGKGSTSGKPSPEASIPMEAMSESQPSWPTPN
jgi:hypothetical protein